MKRIKLTQGKYAIVDDEDYPYLSRFHWTLNNGGYPTLQIHQKAVHEANIQMAMFIIGKKYWWQDFIYKNKNPMDNRKSNIMLGDHSSKLSYARKRTRPTTSKYKGVCWSKQANRWRARINFHNKEFHIGSFKNEKQAAKAYNEKAKEIYGEFAYQNKID